MPWMELLRLFFLPTIIVGFSFLYVKKIGKPLEPMFRQDFPDELKPFFKMKQCEYIAIAHPRHKVLSELKKIDKWDEENIPNVHIDLMTYRFQYEGYATNNAWLETLINILKKGASINIIGGKPNRQRYDEIKVLKDAGANIRFLEDSPTTHIFSCWQDSNPFFIWFEKDHQDDKATCVAFTRNPSADDGELARNFFNDIWSRGAEF